MVLILAVGVTVVVAVVVVIVINSRQAVTYATHIPQTTRTTRLIFCRYDYTRTYALQGAQLRGQSLNEFLSYPQYPEKKTILRCGRKLDSFGPGMSQEVLC